jgi:Protein of unknown function (DUF4232)
VKNALLAVPLLAAGVLAAGCAASSTSTTAAGSSPSGASSAGASSATAAATGAASSAASAGASSSGATTSGTPACTSADLKVSLGGGAGAGMSQNHIGLQLRNTGSSPCTVYGYPGVSWVAGTDGHQVGAAAQRQANNSGSAEQTVTLAAGALASAPLDIVDAAVIPPAECKPVPVLGLRVYPPGETAALFLPLATGSGGYGECSLTTKQPTLTIGYLQAGVQPGGGDVG